MKQQKIKMSLAGLFLMLATLQPALAQHDSENMSLLSRSPYGTCEVVFIDGDYAYIGNGAVFEVLDISNPNAPRHVGETTTPSGVRGIHVVGRYAYVAVLRAGLRIIDVGDPSNPREVAFVGTMRYATDVYVSGQYAYVAANREGLKIIDISDPTHPVEVGSSLMNAYGVHVSGDYAYVADFNGLLRIVDVADPTNPTEIGNCEIERQAAAVVVAGDYAYVAAIATGLHVVDISDPAHPTEVGRCDSPGMAFGIAVVGQYGYLADSDHGLRIIDLSTPSAPAEVGFYEPVRRNMVNVFYSGGLIYVADRLQGLRIINVDAASSPEEIGAYEVGGWISDIAVKNKYAFIAKRSNGTRIMDVSTPSSPTETAFFDTDGYAYGVALKGRYAYIADGITGLHIVDISTPSSPAEVGAVAIPDREPTHIAVQGQYAYVTARRGVVSSEFYVIDVSDPSAPTVAGSLELPDGATDLAMSGEYAYVTCYNTGLYVIDVSSPSAPVQVAFLDIGGSTKGVAVRDHYAYIAGGFYGFRVIDVSTPSVPVEIASLNIGGFTSDVFVLNRNYAYIFINSWGVHAIDISSPTTPTQVGSFEIANRNIVLSARDRYVYVGTGDAGFYILQNDLLPPPRPDESKVTVYEGAPHDQFGKSVAIDGDYAVVGAPYDDNDNGVDAGAAYVYKRKGGEWVRQARLLAGDGAAEDLFGYAVDISGDFIVIGSCWDDDAGEKSGSAYVFRRDEEAWVQKAKLVADDAGEDNRFGIGVAVDDDHIIVGAFFDDDFGSRSGSAYIFSYTGGGWSQQARLLAGDGAEGDWFGVDVAIDGDRAVVGARYDDNENGVDAGAAYVFAREGSAWNEEAKLLAGDGAAGDLFQPVSISGDWIAVGAYQDDDNGANSGSVYLFHRREGAWVEASKLLAADGASGDLFGCSVALDGGVLAVGAYRDDDNTGAVYVYELTDGEWGALEKVAASYGDAGDYFGAQVDVSSNKMIVGARNDDDNGDNAGAAYIYNLRLTPKVLRVPAEFPTIGEAMAVAGYGDTVLVAAGAYPESLVMNEGVILLSEEGPTETTILGSGVSTLIRGAQDAVIRGFTIAGNDNGEGQAGSGVYSDGDNVTVCFCIIRDNHTGLYLNNGSRARVYNNTIDGNSSSGIYMQIEPSPEIYNNIISGAGEAGIYRNTAHSLGAPFIQYNCYFSNGVDFGYYGSEWTPEPGVGDVFADPRFVGGSPFDYHLSDASPCIDAGDPASPNDPDGSRADMGALYHVWPTGAAAMADKPPVEFRLHPAHPNPFNPSTTIEYDLPQAAFVELTVHDVLGREVRRLAYAKKAAGRFSVKWDGRNQAGDAAASGVYFYRLEAKTAQRTMTDMGKMILMK